MRAPFEKLPRLPTCRPPIPFAPMLLFVLGNLQRTVAVASRRGHQPPQRHGDEGIPAWHRTGSRQIMTHTSSHPHAGVPCVETRACSSTNNGPQGGRAIAFAGSRAAATRRRHVRATRHARAQLQAAAGRRWQHQPPCLASARTRGWVGRASMRDSVRSDSTLAFLVYHPNLEVIDFNSKLRLRFLTYSLNLVARNFRFQPPCLPLALLCPCPRRQQNGNRTAGAYRSRRLRCWFCCVWRRHRSRCSWSKSATRLVFSHGRPSLLN